MAYDVKKTDHLFIPFSRRGLALRDSKNNTKIYKDIKTLKQHNKETHSEEAWLTNQYYADVVEYAPVVHGRWIEVRGRYVCSVCKSRALLHFGGIGQYLSPFCPECSAKMDKEENP